MKEEFLTEEKYHSANEKVKKVGKLGIWLIDDESEMPDVLTFNPYVVETNGGVKP